MGGKKVFQAEAKTPPSDVLIVGVAIFGALCLIFAPSLPTPTPTPAGVDMESLSQKQTEMFHENVGTLTKQFMDEHTANMMKQMSQEQVDIIQASLAPGGSQKDFLEEMVVKDLHARISEQVDLQAAPKFAQIKEETANEMQNGVEEIQKSVSRAKAVLDEVELLLEEARARGANNNDEALRVVGEVIDESVARLHADQTDKADYALYALGARVLYASSSMMLARTPNMLQKLLGVEGSKVPQKRVETMMMQGNMKPGECWPMEGPQGFALLSLKQPITVESFSIEHPLKGVNPCVDSTPKTVKLYGINGDLDPKSRMLETDDLDKDLLATLEYDINGYSLQEAAVQSPSKEHQLVLMEVESNYGAEYTCLYRLRIHGQPVA